MIVIIAGTMTYRSADTPRLAPAPFDNPGHFVPSDVALVGVTGHDFIYLDVADPRNAAMKTKLEFVATPHFVFLDSSGSPAASFRGVVPADSLVRTLDRLLVPRRRLSLRGRATVR